MSAVRNRWENTIQKALLKFSACMNKAVAEYHSGWNLDDYMTCAKQYYLNDTGKQFIHELCWTEVQRLPKFCICTENMTSEMKKSLELDETPDSPLGDKELKENAAPGSKHSKNSLAMTPRPGFGKKVAKRLKFSSKNDNEGNWKQQMFDRWAKSDEDKVKLQRDKYDLSLFAMTPESEECKKFLKVKQEEAMLEAEIAVALKKLQRLQMETEEMLT